VSNADSYAVAGGRFEVGTDRRSLVAVVLVGKLLDAGSTATVLALRENVAESTWLTRTLMEQFGVVPGVLVTVVVAVVGVAALAESGHALARLAPDAWTPEGYPTAFRVVTCWSSGAWYGVVGVHNVSLLL